MNRRSFITLTGLAPLLRMPLWGQNQGSPISVVKDWGPPFIRSARGEHKRAVVSFTPVDGATSYVVRCQAASGAVMTLDGVPVSDYTLHGLEDGKEYRISVAAAGSKGVTAFSAEMAVTPVPEMSWATLAEAFSGSNPTRSSCPFWMIHGDESPETLRQFLEVAYRFGFEGVTLHPYDYKDFLGEGEWSRWKVIVDHARRLGLAVWQQDDKDYPSGYAGGTIVKKNREMARWEIALIHESAYQGPAQAELNIASVLPKTHRLVSVSAFGPDGRVADLTARAASEVLRWDVPEGSWKLYATAMWQPGLDAPQGPALIRGELRGYIDPLSEKATDLYVDAISGATYRQLGDEFGRTWKGFFIDEPGFYTSGVTLGKPGDGYPWTPDLPARFERRYGYAPAPLLPLLWHSGGSKTAQVRRDYMDLTTSEFARLFIGKLATFAETHGIQIAGHVIESSPYEFGPGTGNNFRTLEQFSIAGFDHIFDQWYVPDEDVYWRQTKMASSISHYRETPQDEALVEHFAATGWRTGLTEMKAMMDWTTCRGLNRIVPCGFDTQKPPVWEDAPEFWLHGANPLAPYFRAYQVMANRETMLIRGGRHVALALVLDPAESAWAGPVEELWRVNKALSQAHFDYDNVSFDVFADETRCRIDGGRILLGHEDYQFVVLPGVDAIPPRVLERMLAFSQAGGAVILLGPEIRFDGASLQILPRLPFRSTDGRSDAEVQKLATRIWSGEAGSAGRAYRASYKDIANLLYSLDAHDVWIEPNLAMLQYYHRRLSGRNLYFFNNEGEAVHTEVRLRDARGVPEFWDPVTGRIFQAPSYRPEDGGLRVRLDLERYESLFVVVNPEATPEPHLWESDADLVSRESDGRIVMRKYSSGVIHYVTDREKERTWGTPPGNLSPLPLSQGWTRTPGEAGSAIYRIDFPFRSGPTGAELRIDKMTQVLRATLNGRDLGTRLVHPFRFDLTPLRADNTLELSHVERPTFESRLGTARIVPYYGIQV